MEKKTVTTEFKDRICILTLNDPDQLNAMSEEMSVGFRDTITALSEDERVKVLVLTGAGRAFSAGGNLDTIASGYRGTRVFRRSPLLNFTAGFCASVNWAFPP